MQRYTVSEAAKRMNLTAHTLRFYDKEGLLPFVERGPGGARSFKESDFEWLSLIECLKATGMPIKDIRTFIGWCMEGDSTIPKRYEMFLERKKIAEQQLWEAQRVLEKINCKCWYYETALSAGTEAVHHCIKCRCDSLPKEEKEPEKPAEKEPEAC